MTQRYAVEIRGLQNASVRIFVPRRYLNPDSPISRMPPLLAGDLLADVVRRDWEGGEYTKEEAALFNPQAWQDDGFRGWLSISNVANCEFKLEVTDEGAGYWIRTDN